MCYNDAQSENGTEMVINEISQGPHSYLINISINMSFFFFNFYFMRQRNRKIIDLIREGKQANKQTSMAVIYQLHIPSVLWTIWRDRIVYVPSTLDPKEKMSHSKDWQARHRTNKVIRSL